MERSEVAAIRRAEVWTRWAQGGSQRGIARTLGVSTTAVRKILRRRGGLIPPVRRRALRVLCRDGVIVVTEAVEAVRIRTGERAAAAL